MPAYANLADLYRARGADGEAVAVLREGLARNPRAAALHHALGLALVRQKQTAEGLKALRAAAELAPESARFAYVYAVALNDAGQTTEALQVLAAALKRAALRPRRSCPASRSSRRRPATASSRWATSGSCASSTRRMPQYAQMAQQIEGALRAATCAARPRARPSSPSAATR